MRRNAHKVTQNAQKFAIFRNFSHVEKAALAQMIDVLVVWARRRQRVAGSVQRIENRTQNIENRSDKRNLKIKYKKLKLQIKI